VNPVAGEALSETVLAGDTLAGFPAASWDCTVTAAEQPPAVTVRAGVVKTNAAGGPAAIVSVWKALDSPPAAAVTVAARTCVPLKKKEAVVVPAGMVIEDTAEVHEALE
jgi:hypothetical protein